MGDYVRPAGLDEALEFLARRPFTVLAGGTDLYAAHAGRPILGDLLDITAIPSLRGVAAADGHWRIGATTTWSDLLAADLPPLFDGLKAAAREIGGRQVQNAGTIAGNVCNASPAADGVPVLLTLDAEVELAGPGRLRRLPLASFISGSRETRLASGELVTAIIIPRPSHAVRSAFVKLGARRSLVISIASVAAVLEIGDGKVVAARLAVGACSATPVRLPELEGRLRGAPLAGLGARVAHTHLAALSPIDDVRADGGYRRAAVLVLLSRVLEEMGAS